MERRVEQEPRAKSGLNSKIHPAGERFYNARGLPLLAVDMLAVWKLNYTKCDESEIRTGRLIWTRRCPWPQVSDITVARVSLNTGNPYARGKTRAVRVHTASGRSFLLGAPIDGGFKSNPDFDASVAKIRAFWRTERARHPGRLWLYSWPTTG